MKKRQSSFLLAFLFASPLSAQTAPGGVSENLNYWLKADAGVTRTANLVRQWDNQTTIASNVSQSNPARQPGFTENALNFNPAISFSAGASSLGSFTPTDFDFLRTDDPVWDSNTVIIVFNPSQISGDDGILQTVLVYDIPNNLNGDAGIGIGSTAIFSGASANDNFFNSTDISPAQAGEYIGASRVSPNVTEDAILAVVRQNADTNPSASEHRFWGKQANLNITNQNQYASHQNTEFTIGQRDGGGLPYDGDVLEAISYSARLDDPSLRRIESYLAIKYGLTLNQQPQQDYVNSSGTTIYDADGILSGFVSNIAGIGRDDASGLNQKQSISTTTNSVQTNNSGLVTIGLGTIAQTNNLNSNRFTNNNSFMLWGNNAASTRFNTALTVDAMPFKRMQRIWRIQETGTVGIITLSVRKPLFDTTNPMLIVSEDAILDSNDTAIQLTDDGNGNYTAIVDFSDGDYFTFAQTANTTLPNEGEVFVLPLPDGAVIFEL